MANWLLGEPEDQHINLPPLSLVVCQVRHQNEVSAGAVGRALRIQGELGWESELQENLGQELSLNTIDGATLHSASHNTTKGWRYTSPDQLWIATVMPDFFTLETKRYGGWAEFEKRFEALTRIVADQVGPEIEHRVGLRYMNEISFSQVESPADWEGLIDERLLQATLLRDLGESLRATLQVIEFRTTENRSLVLRHGTQKRPDADSWQYIIDNDCSRQGAREFVPDSIMGDLVSLHKFALNAFEMATTSRLRSLLRGLA